MKLDWEEGKYYCFGCDARGNAYDFVKSAEGVSDIEAMKRYVKILRSQKVRKIKANTVHKQKVDYQYALTIADDYYTNLKTIDWYEEDGPEIDYMLDRGFSRRILNEVGMKYTYNSSYPLILPMRDNGTFVGWVCRTTDKRIEKRRKYLYNEGFHRSTTLCGEYHSKTVVICEGYMDMLKFKMYGIENVVAILGWKISGQQIEKLKKAGVKLVISALDNDPCGKKGTEYLKQFFDVIPFQYPDGVKDSGEMSKKQFNCAYVKTKNLVKKRRKLK